MLERRHNSAEQKWWFVSVMVNHMALEGTKKWSYFCWKHLVLCLEPVVQVSPWGAPQLFKDTTPTSSRVGDWEWQLPLFRRVLWKAWSLSWGEQLYLDKNWMSLLLEIACFLMPSSWRNAIVCASRVPSINFDDPVLLVFPFKKIRRGESTMSIWILLQVIVFCCFWCDDFPWK